MQPSLVVLATVFVASTFVFARFGAFGPPGSTDWRVLTGFLITGFVLLPSTIAVLAAQAGAERRLAAVGIAPHPDLRHSVGIAVGLGDRPFWVFVADPGDEDPLGFYDDPANLDGWHVLERSPGMRILGSDGRRASVSWSLASRTLQVTTYDANDGVRQELDDRTPR